MRVLFALLVGYVVLLVQHPPLEDAAEPGRPLVHGPVLERRVIDAVYDGHRHPGPVDRQSQDPVRRAGDGRHTAVSTGCHA